MAKELRHRDDIVNLLQDRAKGLTFDQILKHFDDPPPPKNAAPYKFKLASDATFKLRAKIQSYLLHFQKSEEVVLSDGVYKLNFARGDPTTD